MREFTRKIERAPLRLKRSVDGRLRSASEGEGVADIWAEQKRIRLAEAILEDKRRKEKKHARRELFKRSVFKARSAPQALKKIKGLKLNVAWVRRRKLPSKRVLAVGGLLAVTGLFFVLTPFFSKKAELTKKGVTSEVLNKKTEKPTYPTLVPEGKNIDDLGGWQRVSPPEASPVFAFVDQINGVQVNVSEQPLPESFKKNTSESISKLAEQFTANEKLTVEGLTAYIGTSEKGPQSVIFAKGDLLVLLKSSDKIPSEIWGVYVASLK